MPSRKLKWLANACFIVGFAIPFFVSHYVGMRLGKMPLVSAANIVLWVAGLVLAYFAFLQEKKPAPTVSRVMRIGNFVSAYASSCLTLGILFGYLFYPTVEKSIVPAAGPYLLMTIMFTMGLAISFQDWKRMAARPKLITVSVVLRWIVMPAVAFVLSLALLRAFPGVTGKALAVGIIVIGTTPTGGGSNALTMISKGDLALSVSVTSLNTVLAPFLQPVMILWLAGGIAALNANALFQDLLYLVVAPVLAGTILGSIFPRAVSKIKPIFAPLAVVCLSFIVMGTMSKGTSTLIKQFSVLLYLVVACLILALAGLFLGFYVPKLFKFNYAQRKAACFEVGVQNAALAMLVALRHFDPLTALPSIVYGKIQYIVTSAFFVPRLQKLEDKPLVEAVVTEKGAVEPAGR
jgi:BASS family bile acid:Na+ symporter